MKRSIINVMVVVSLVGLAVGCGGDGDDGADTSGITAAPPETVASVAPNGVTVEVQALDNSFRPETLEIAAGTEVVFSNVGRNDHNVLPADVEPGQMGEWGVATEDFPPRAEYRYVFTRPGTYAYYCSIHGTADVGMIGTVVVTG